MREAGEKGVSFVYDVCMRGDSARLTQRTAGVGEVKRIFVRGRHEIWCVCGCCGKKLFPVDTATRIDGLILQCRGCGLILRIRVGE